MAEALQIGEQLAVHIVDEIGPGLRAIVIEPALRVLRRGPASPAMALVDDRRVGAAGEVGVQRATFLQIVEIFEEEEPAGLLDIIEFGRAAGLLPEDVIDIPENLFEHLPSRVWPA